MLHIDHSSKVTDSSKYCMYLKTGVLAARPIPQSICNLVPNLSGQLEKFFRVWNTRLHQPYSFQGMDFIKDDEIYGHLSVISLPLENLEFYTINFPKTQVVNVV